MEITFLIMYYLCFQSVINYIGKLILGLKNLFLIGPVGRPPFTPRGPRVVVSRFIDFRKGRSSGFRIFDRVTGDEIGRRGPFTNVVGWGLKDGERKITG